MATGVSSSAPRSLASAVSTFDHDVLCVKIAPTITSKGVSAGHQCCGPSVVKRLLKYSSSGGCDFSVPWPGTLKSRWGPKIESFWSPAVMKNHNSERRFASQAVVLRVGHTTVADVQTRSCASAFEFSHEANQRFDGFDFHRF